MPSLFRNICPKASPRAERHAPDSMLQEVACPLQAYAEGFRMRTALCAPGPVAGFTSLGTSARHAAGNRSSWVLPCLGAHLSER